LDLNKQIVKKHFDKLASIKYERQGEIPINRNLLIKFCKNKKLKSLERINREDIFKLTNDKFVSDFELTILVLLWGGIRKSNLELFIEEKKKWTPLINEIRNSKKSNRKDVFKKFQELRKNGSIKGVGIAFYTKLIYFLSKDRSNVGYILDQWTAKSINLLFTPKEIKLYGSSFVSDKNDESNYERFCKKIEFLSKKLKCTPSEAEEMIFSYGGRKRGEWRIYLNDNYN